MNFREGPFALPFVFVIIIRKKIDGLSERSLARFLARARRAAKVRGRVDLVLTGSNEVRGLNRRFRGKDLATDVLSFPPSAEAPGPVSLAGDIVISAEAARENARRLGHLAADEVKILVLHGLLHLAGYDHEHDAGQMACTEARLRRALHLPMSLTERAAAPSRNPRRTS